MARIIKRNVELNQILKESVRIAMLELLEAQDMTTITVTDICKRAGVSRAGFYRNYATKEDVMAEISREFIADLIRKVGSYFDDIEDNHERWYYEYFRFLYSSRKMAMVIYKSNLEAFHLHTVNEMITHLSEDITNAERLRRYAFNGAIHNISVYWLTNGCTIPVEEIAGYCAKYMK